jgi:dTDP-4-dehydrorhamnose reductase
VISETKTKILLLGKNGQLGYELGRKLPACGDVVSLGREDLDLSKPQEIRRAVQEARPDFIVNAAAYTAVDQAESDEASAAQVNAIAPGILAEAAREIDAALIHYSTDYVFDGSKTTAYAESDRPNPLNVYGRTKLAGELAIEEAGGQHFIFRTGWLYSMRGRNFLTTILKLGSGREKVQVVDDQFGAPTWTRDVAEATAQVICKLVGHGKRPNVGGRAERNGVYHMSAAGTASWADFAAAILDVSQTLPELKLVARRIVPISTADYPTLARRPAYSVLSNARLKQTFDVRLPEWRTQLQSALRT